MRKYNLFLSAAVMSIAISYNCMAADADLSAGISDGQSASSFTTELPAETTASSEAVPQNGEDGYDPSSLEGIIKTYEQGLGNPSVQQEQGPETTMYEIETEYLTESITATEETSGSVESETVQDTEALSENIPDIIPETETDPLPQNESETTPESESETEEADYTEVPSEGVTEVMQEIYSYLRHELGFNHAAACGVLANIKYESDYNPAANGDSGSSYGLCQWHNERYSSLTGFCSNNGFDYSSVSGQMAYLNNELSNGYRGVLEHLSSVPDTAQGAYDAAYYWCIHFEAPANMETRAQERANCAAEELFGKSFTYVKTMKKAVADIRHEILEDAFVNASDEQVYASVIEMVRPH